MIRQHHQRRQSRRARCPRRVHGRLVFTMPHLAVNGALFTGNGAAMHSTPAIKGIHLAMKSGMLAAEAIA
jgi:flavin-dependent dehydrogenase